MSLPARIITKTILNILLVWAIATFLPQYMTITGGWWAFVVIGALLTLMNLLVRPLIAIITFPLKLFATILAIILANGLFLWLTVQIAERMDPSIVHLTVNGGLFGWIVLSLILGLCNWVFKEILPHKKESK